MDPKEKSFYVAVLIVCGVVGIIIAYFIISLIRQHRRSRGLYRKSIYTEITTLEKERTRIAADLHDEVGPVLSAIKLRLGSLDINNADDEEEIQKTNGQIDGLLKRMREISFDLMPNSLVRKGLAVAMGEFVEYIAKSNSLKIQLKLQQVSLTQQQSINLYRIIQEVIHNTIKHAGATILVIELKEEKKKIILSTQDNGIGFSYETKSMEARGLGLQNLLSRTEIMGGKMFFESKKGKGTSYTFELPTASDEYSNAHPDHSGR